MFNKTKSSWNIIRCYDIKRIWMYTSQILHGGNTLFDIKHKTRPD